MSALERFLALADADAHEARQVCIAPAEDAPQINLASIPVSVFQIGIKPITCKPMTKKTANSQVLKVSAHSIPADGVRRVEGAAYPARWTADDYRKEEIRRAKQRPPKPSAKAKTKSDKLKQLIGA